MKRVLIVISIISLIFLSTTNNLYAKNHNAKNSSEYVDLGIIDNMSIDNFIKYVAKVTQKNILVTRSIPGKVNFIPMKPVKKERLKAIMYDLLINVLNTKGYTIVDSHKGYLKVIRSSEASKSAPPLYGHSDIDQVQTKIIQVKNLDAIAIYKQISFLLSKYGRIVVAREINSIIVTDFPQNIRTIQNLISILDRHENSVVEFVELENIGVKDVYQKVQKIANALFDKRVQTQKMEILKDEGTNSIILISKRKNIEKIIPYIKKLDKANDISQKKISIIHIKNADAEKIAQTLQNLLSNKSFVQSISSGSSSKNKKLPSKPGAKTKAPPPLVSFPKNISSANSDKPSITVDKELNAIIIYASDRETKELKNIIEQLDIERQQVYVKAKIVEISLDKSSKIGAKYGLIGGIADSTGLYTLSAIFGTGAKAIPIDIGSLGITKPTLDKGLALGATLSLLADEGAADLISEPSILCVNNHESTIYVGRTESVITQSSTGTSTTDVTRNTYTRQDIGLTLKIKPRISADNKVTLETKIILEDVVPGSQVGLPTTTKREVETTAIVDNGESIILGGLVKDKKNNSLSKVPILGDIPIVGIPFRYREKQDTKVSLAVLLTPYIVNKSSDLSKLRLMLGRLNMIEKELAKRAKKGKKKKEDKSYKKRKDVDFIESPLETPDYE